MLGAREMIAGLRPGLLRLLQALVQEDSVAIPPRGNETAAQQVLSDFLHAHGIAAEMYGVEWLRDSGHRMVRHDREYAGRKNLTAHVSGSGRGRSLLLNGHIDTVPPADGAWHSSPWSGASEKGRLYGLGSFDMKAGIVAQAGVLCALVESGVKLGGDVMFESVVDEEWGGCGGSLAARLHGGIADACVISEGTQLEVFRATRGGFVVDLVVEAGDPANYFSSTEVASPASHVARLLGWVENWRSRRAAISGSAAYSNFADPAPLQILAIEANRMDQNVPLSVPLKAGVRLYWQFLPSEDVTEVLQNVQQSLRIFEQNDFFFRVHPIRWAPLYDPPLLGHEVPEDHAFVECMLQSGATMMGATPKLSAAPYPCDAFLMDREFGIPTLLFGPRGGGAHNVNEYVEFDSVIGTAEVLLETALQWCNG